MASRFQPWLASSLLLMITQMASAQAAPLCRPGANTCPGESDSRPLLSTGLTKSLRESTEVAQFVLAPGLTSDPEISSTQSPRPKFPESILNQKISPRVIDQLHSQWIKTPEGFLKQTALWIPRMMSQTLRWTFGGRTAQRVFNLGMSGVDLLNVQDSDHLERSAYRLSNSALNLLGLLNDIISDLGSIIQTPLHAAKRLSSRMEICTNNLMEALGADAPALHTLNPTVHVGAVIDGVRSVKESGDLMDTLTKNRGAICTPVTLPSNLTESAALFRTLCADQIYRTDAEYEFFGYNCGGYTRDLLNWTGSDMNIIPNLGVGTQIQILSEKNTQKIREKHSSKLSGQCDLTMQSLIQAALIMESGETLRLDYRNVVGRKAVFPGSGLSHDLGLQLVLSAARGKNPDNREFMAKLATGTTVFSNYLTKEKRIKSHLRPLLASMFIELDDEALTWLVEHYPTIQDILKDLATTHSKT